MNDPRRLSLAEWRAQSLSEQHTRFVQTCDDWYTAARVYLATPEREAEQRQEIERLFKKAESAWQGLVGQLARELAMPPIKLNNHPGKCRCDQCNELYGPIKAST